MIKFKATGKDGRKVVGLGVSAGNIGELLKGNPLLVHAEDIELPFDIVVFFGATDQSLADELVKHGFVGPETVVRDLRGRKRN